MSRLQVTIPSPWSISASQRARETKLVSSSRSIVRSRSFPPTLRCLDYLLKPGERLGAQPAGLHAQWLGLFGGLTVVGLPCPVQGAPVPVAPGRLVLLRPA